MLEELSGEEVHWKGKSFDCETFALACPDCENYEKRIKYALKNMQEEKVGHLISRKEWLTHKAPPILCSRQQFQMFLLFQK